ncbi:putative glycolipid-binding domain-containing protein [Alkalibacillus haloalkaliphilus]|uniref:putative glycolipid-binding domain-containing protein n=1 Tax=Alkalibacillus haloalkaliphilus TaxID=94136 RepID=UPI00037C34D8|nr:putative glycolipid-binding domain-containing protein [Alkalibacillus haloalkaliphilus]
MHGKIVWNNEELFGCEYLRIRSTNEKFIVHSTVIYVDNSNAHNLNYNVELDEHWLTKKFSIVVRMKRLRYMNKSFLFTNGAIVQ